MSERSGRRVAATAGAEARRAEAAPVGETPDAAAPAKPAKPPPSIRKARLAATKAAILQSALETFSERGFEGASTRAVAAKAGVNHGMIRHIYQSKEELWRAAIAFMFERANAEMAHAFSDLPLRQRFEARTRRYVQYCAEHPEHARLMIQLSAVASPPLAPEVEQFARTRHTGIVNDIRLLKKEGLLPNVDSSSLLISFVASCQMIYLLAAEIKANADRDVFAPEAIERHADAVVALFLR